MVELRMWQRRHGPDLVAEVTPVPGMGNWDVCMWREPNRQDVRQGASFGFLTDAMQAADALVAVSTGHSCDESCGNWEAIERRRKPRPVKA